MNPIPPSVIPPPNLDKEEPELAYEEDIPSDDQPSVDEDGQVERE